MKLKIFSLGHTEKIKSRSILCGAEGFVTFVLKTFHKMNHVGYVWTIIRKIFPPEINNQIKGMKIFADSEGCAFDVPEEMSKDFEEKMKADRFYDKHFTIELAEELPALTDGGRVEYAGRITNDRNGSWNGHGHGNSNGNDRSSHSQPQSTHRSKNKGTFLKKDRRDIFIGNIPFNIDVEDIKQFLKSYKVDPETNVDIRIAIDQNTGKQRGFCFVSTYEEAKFNQILSLDGKKFKDRAIKISSAKENENK